MNWCLCSLGTRKIVEFIVLMIFVVFFLGPLTNLLLLAVSGKWQYPAPLPQSLSLEWWKFVFTQDDVLSSISLSFLITVTVCSIIVCVPAAYAFGFHSRLASSFCSHFCSLMLFRKWACTCPLRCCSTNKIEVSGEEAAYD
jgi:ABC-type spermidine/putrescine transport system permease subunit II